MMVNVYVGYLSPANFLSAMTPRERMDQHCDLQVL